MSDTSSTPRPMVCVDFGDESSWGEHVEGDVYRSLNGCLNACPLNLPADIDMSTMPEGHPGPDQNGMQCRMHWGHLFRGQVLREGRVKPLEIIGHDKTPRRDLAL